MNLRCAALGALAILLPIAARADGQSAYAAGAELGYQQNAAGQNREALVGAAQGQMGSLYLGNVTRPESSVFAGGRGDMGAAGMARRASCKVYVPAEGENLTAEQKAENAECAAVNMLDGGLLTPTESISRSDPLTSMARRAASDPAELMSEKGISLNTSDLNCTPVTKTIPATYQTETCIVGSDVKDQTCDKYITSFVVIAGCQPGEVFGSVFAPSTESGGLAVDALCSLDGLEQSKPSLRVRWGNTSTLINYNGSSVMPTGRALIYRTSGGCFWSCAAGSSEVGVFTTDETRCDAATNVCTLGIRITPYSNPPLVATNCVSYGETYTCDYYTDMSYCAPEDRSASSGGCVFRYDGTPTACGRHSCFAGSSSGLLQYPAESTRYNNEFQWTNDCTLLEDLAK